jgi:3-dehydroquinate dehydratase-1
VKTLKIKTCTLGEARMLNSGATPKIITSIMAADEASLIKEAESYLGLDFDILEWRADYFTSAVPASLIIDIEKAAAALRAIIDKPLLFTFRTEAEGGAQSISAEDYITLNKAIVASGNVDMIDIELGCEARMLDSSDTIKDFIAYAHDFWVMVVVSNHDFHKTPSKAEIIRRLEKMQALGADIPKIAVMPESADDVLTLLAATAEWYKVAIQPFITISMSQLGAISRLATFGSCATFGAATKSSAPGQLAVNELRAMLANLS